MNTSTNISAPSFRRRWKMYHRGIRMAARLERGDMAGRALPIEADACRRAARDWAAPFLHRLF